METTSVSYIRDVCLGLVHGVYYSRWHLFHSYAVVPVGIIILLMILYGLNQLLTQCFQNYVSLFCVGHVDQLGGSLHLECFVTASGSGEVVAAACWVNIVSFAYSLFDINQAVDELYLEMDQCIFHSIVHHFAAFRPHKFHRVPQDSGCVCGGVFGSLFSLTYTSFGVSSKYWHSLICFQKQKMPLRLQTKNLQKT
ncbi:hypothetical protein PGUG_01735 [Meyerozyma guilliermondii ATCC 6260]|uniref:Uncharacterized protein n=1 Tax=Meyerozyma guilliermondii (strain ATCC 6260 / CBS 566 / DSM 6381 / JCM 1539 / NBRC 10279 / NRRL Y-324) TaxID=294746 RepID=A5DEN4_PICGU|nr:uncharacterized protein PGUG_01735 [Meyerozyma guilliermondii ATCC 6260]EDK37637.1 hypothetical protein PGUG_01735 [Meyerozyma guilliermondii ATCC 6260]